MANLADKSGDAYSNIVQGTGTNSVTFRTPGAVPLDVESVVATIDNTAGGATTATLTIRDASGQVIATKRQGDTIPAGDTGTATFALRLADDGGGIDFDKANVGDYLLVTTTGDRPTTTTGVEFDVSEDFLVDADRVFLFADLNPGSALELRAENYIRIRSESTLYLTAFNGPFFWEAEGMTLNPGPYWQSIVGNLGITLDCRGPFTLDNSGGTDKIVLRVAAGSSVEIQDSGQNPIFRVDESGDLHGKTGKALVFDL